MLTPILSACLRNLEKTYRGNAATERTLLKNAAADGSVTDADADRQNAISMYTSAASKLSNAVLAAAALDQPDEGRIFTALHEIVDQNSAVLFPTLNREDRMATQSAAMHIINSILALIPFMFSQFAQLVV